MSSTLQPAATQQQQQRFQCSRAQLLTGAAVAAGIGAATVMLITRLLRKRAQRRAAAEAAALAAPITRSELIFMGCGSSTGVPRAICVADPESECKVSLSARGNPVAYSSSNDRSLV